MKKRAPLVAGIGIWSLISAPAAAQSAMPAPAPSVPGNTVSCAYDYMGPEDREMALLLIAREIVDGGKFSKTSPNVMAVDRLIAEAQEKCLDRFNWSIGRTESASGFALTSILTEALSQALASFELPVTPLGDYFAENRLLLSARKSMVLTDRLKLRGYLKERGWDKAREVDFAMAGLYVETLMLKGRAAALFSASGGTGHQVIRRPSSPARKAGRGKP